MQTKGNFHQKVLCEFGLSLSLSSHAKKIIVLRKNSRFPASLNFFSLSFQYCISCVFNCEDLLCIYFFILVVPISEIRIFIISLLLLLLHTFISVMTIFYRLF